MNGVSGRASTDLGGRMWRRLGMLVMVGALLAPLGAWATHEVDHRYTIWGDVRDDQGAPRANAPVAITGLGGRPLGDGATDENGRYMIQLHVHNQDLGAKFWVTVEGQTRSGTVTFNPSDRMQERGHRIDFPAPAE